MAYLSDSIAVVSLAAQKVNARSLLKGIRPKLICLAFILSLVGNIHAETIVYESDFEDTGNPLSEWSRKGTSTTPGGSRAVTRFLGELSNQTTTLSLSALPEHQFLRIEFDFYAIRSWDGNNPANAPGRDIVEVREASSATPLLITSFGYERDQSYPGRYPDENFPGGTGAQETDSLGYGSDHVFRISVSMPHTSDSAAISFLARNLQDISDESWGLDNVRVVVSDLPPQEFELVAWWQFDEPGGAVASDASRTATAHHGTLSHASFAPDAGRFGGALQMSRDDAIVTVPDSPELEFPADQSFSLTFFIKGSGAFADAGVITKGYGSASPVPGYYGISSDFGDGNRGGFQSNNPNAPGQSVLVHDGNGINLLDNEWHHVAVVRDCRADQIRIHVDGGTPAIHTMGLDDTNGDWDMGVNDAPLVLGQIGDGVDGVTALLDDVAIFRSALSHSAIERIARSGVESLVRPEYRITNLGTLGGAESEARAINESNTVVGWSHSAGGVIRPFVWDDANGMVELPANAGPSEANDVNDLDQIVGFSQTSDTARPRAFLWENGTATDLGPYSGAGTSAHGINDGGRIVGRTIHSSAYDGFRYDNGKFQWLPQFDSHTTLAYRVNQSGNIVGFSNAGPGDRKAVLWLNGGTSITKVASTGSDQGTTHDINDNDHAVGELENDAGNKEGFFWENGNHFYVGALFGDHSRLYGINNADTAVGESEVDASGTVHAIIWRDENQNEQTDFNEMRDLNDAIPLGFDWELTAARDISEGGAIVGHGLADGERRAFLLTPVRDSDNDGLTDAWEVQYFGTIEAHSGTDDPDKDLLINEDEEASGTVPSLRDTDGDFYGDGDELLGRSDPRSDSSLPDDRDGDFLGDAFEESIGTEPNRRDTDRDGYLDGDEINSGSDPLDPSDTPSDRDGDGMSDAWEVENGLDPDVDDSEEDLDDDGLLNKTEYRLNTDAGSADTDDDGITDDVEFFVYGTSPRRVDSDGDRIDDGYEVANDLNPFFNDAGLDRDFDFVTNNDEFNLGLSANNPDSNGDSISDFHQTNGGNRIAHLYDRNDRLVGSHYDKNFSIGFRYDGNSNPTRRVYLGADDDGDGLLGVWEFANQLDPFSALGANGFAGDLDGDGWTNGQEAIGGSSATDLRDLPGSEGKPIGVMDVSFTPTRFVAGAGEVGSGAGRWVAVGADGDPGADMNYVRIFREVGEEWAFDDVGVGSYGVTSLAVGQIPGREPSVYAGLRKVGGLGRIVELSKEGESWKSTVVAVSQSEEAYVHGFWSAPIPANKTNLLVSFESILGAAGGLKRIYSTGSDLNASLLDPSVSTRGTGVGFDREGETSAYSRLLDAGGVQVISEVPVGDSSELIDDFDDEEIDGDWESSSANGGLSSNGGHILEEDGVIELRANWNDGSGETTHRTLTRELEWPTETSGLSISVQSAEHYQFFENDAQNGSNVVRVGPTTVYTSGKKNRETAVQIQVIRRESHVYFRKKIGQGSWGSWSAGASGSELTLRVSGRDVSGGDHANGSFALLRVDSISFERISDLLLEGKSAADFSDSNAAYHSDSGLWYFRDPTPRSWTHANGRALQLGGNLAPVESAALNSWLTSKFPGDHWIGLYYNDAKSGWAWSSPTSNPFRNWENSHPASEGSGKAASKNGDSWLSGEASEEKTAIHVVGSDDVNGKIAAKVLDEPTSVARLQPLERSIAAGSFNANVASENSILEVFIEDHDHSGDASVGDDFVIAEIVSGAEPGVLRTLDRKPLTERSQTGYGIATAKSSTGGIDALISAEPDGRVNAWVPATAGGPLERRSLGIGQVGRFWHCLESLEMPGVGEGIVGVHTEGSDSANAEVIIWNPDDFDLLNLPVIQETPPVGRIISQTLNNTGDVQIELRLWDAEGNQVTMQLQYWDEATGTWVDMTDLTYLGERMAAATLFEALPGGSTHSLYWIPPQDLTPGDVIIRIRLEDNSQIAPWSDEFAVSLRSSDTPFNLWRQGFFDASQLANPTISGASGHGDEDTVGNLGEYGMARDPTRGSGENGISQLPRTTASDRELRYRFERAEPSPADLKYSIQISDSPKPTGWATVATKEGTGDWAISDLWTNFFTIEEVPASGGRVSTTVVVDLSELGNLRRRFVRVHFELIGSNNP